MNVVDATDLFGEAQDRFCCLSCAGGWITPANGLSPSFKNASAAAAAFHDSSSSQSSIWRLHNYTFARSLVPSFSRRPLQHWLKQHLGQLGLMVGALFSSLRAAFSP